ncbi:TPA: DUF551 domain-containing protein [Klebsiella pneumoniae]|nr:DUF551 domain-containing protein [Klebsiella pneumoniae]HBR5353552.1 DUF551 domain-containing protein [Klebsiella pneumoniae]HBR5369072.1 DUF551 domain-containing protein [Klebsiella pneumoniae]HBR5385266.1 DUF551 domain-containing protein [Klebsiella pneumoniae]HBR5394175.1 DUF551 domain-containing protein [Klebsiella pneumoniae]
MALAAMDSEPHTGDELSNLLWYSQEATCHSDPNYYCEFQRLATPGLIAGIIRELQERRKVDSEPVAIIDQANLDYLLSGADADVWPPEREEMGDVLLYRHPQPAPVVPELRVDWQENEFSAGWNACRTAMLAAAPQSPGSEPATVPGKWIPVSERMPDDDDFVYIWPRPDFGVELHVGQYCERSHKGGGWYAQVYEQNYGIEWHPITVTHWMPLPAAPQEVR